jgi:hypothetical protein
LNRILLVTIGLLTALCSRGATINSGTMFSERRGGEAASTHRITIEGTTQAGNPFLIQLARPAIVPNIGNERCPNISGNPNPALCATWTFTNDPYVVDVSSTSGLLFPGQSIFWDNVTYGLDFGSAYVARLSITVDTPSASSYSTPSVGGSFHSWSFPVANASVVIDLEILQGATTLVSESMSSNAIYWGSAWQAPVGSEWSSAITYQFVPEPATSGVFAASLLAMLGWRWRRCIIKHAAHRW